MKIIKNLSLIIAVLCLGHSVIATADDQYSQRVGNHAPIPPGKAQTIYFDMLNPSIGTGHYVVHCRIYAEDAIRTTMQIQSVKSSQDWADLIVNGFPYVASYSSVNVNLKPGINTIDIGAVNSENGSFTITNNDWRRPIASFNLVNDCVWNEYH